MSSLDESSSSVERTSHLPAKVTKVFKGHTSFVMSIACFPDGQHIASGSSDKTIRIWNAETRQQEGEALEHDSAVSAIAIAPDGGKIASRVVGGMIVWNVVTRKRVREVKIDGGFEQAAYVLVVVFSPDGRWIATASSLDTSIRLWDVDTGNQIRELEQLVDVVYCLSFSPDGTRIATGSDEGSFRVLDISTGNTVVGPIRGHAGTLYSLVYSPDSRLLVTSSDENIRAWDAATGREVGRPMLSPRSIHRHIAISADGKRIASTSPDQTMRLWNLETRLQVGGSVASRVLPWAHPRSVAFSPNGRFVIGGVNYDVYLWDTAALLDGPPSPPTTSNRESSHSIVPSARVTTHPSPPPPLPQQKQTPSKADRDTSSLSSSILDLPAVVQPIPERAKEIERAPSIDDWDSFQPHRQPTAEPTETQQEPRAEPQNLNTPPSASDNQWTHIIRGRWRHWRSPKPSAHVETPQVSPHSPPEQRPTPRKPHPEPATGLSILPSQVNPDAPENPDARPGPKRTLSLFWARLRGTKPRPTESLKTEPPGPQHSPAPPTKGANVAAGRAFTRLMAAPDRLEELVTPPPRVQADDVPPSPSSVGTYEIAEDLRNYRPPWLYRFCYSLCYPRDTHYVTS